jgi:probable rRNA maturation factor
MKILIKKDPRYPLDIKEIRKIAQDILDKYQFPDEVELSLNFVGKRKAKELNEDYRNKEYIPKVLAFPLHEKGPDNVLRIGDIVVCFPLARKEARQRQRMVSEIIEELLEHGIGNLVAK